MRWARVFWSYREESSNGTEHNAEASRSWIELDSLSAGPARSAKTVFAQSTGGIEFTFTFDNDDEGWTTGFADLPADADMEIYELDSGFRPLPEGLIGNGIFLQGHNRSDDLFMFLKRQVAGLRPGAVYQVTISLDIATNVPAGSFGIGGSPGESVFVKAGVSLVEPMFAGDAAGWLRMNIDKGNQASEGDAMINLGNVASPEVTDDKFKIKTLVNDGRPLQVATDGQGQAWLIVGTDSGFEGRTDIYYSRIEFLFSPVEPPGVGGVALPHSVFGAAALLGILLLGFATRILAKRRP